MKQVRKTVLHRKRHGVVRVKTQASASDGGLLEMLACDLPGNCDADRLVDEALARTEVTVRNPFRRRVKRSIVNK